MNLSKSHTLKTLLPLASKWRSEGEVVVFTNGVFDILHIGHLHCLESALALGTKLVVGVNSDASVRRLGKSPDRPIHSDLNRVRLLAALSCVDAVVIFDSDTPLSIITLLSPEVLVKGGDYDPSCTDRKNPDYIVGSTETRAAGGKVHSVPLLQGYSTTQILNQ